MTHTGTTTIDIDEATTTRDAPDATGDEDEDPANSNNDNEEDQVVAERNKTIALSTMPGKRRRVTTSARWESNALRHFKRRFDDDAEREESVAWEREPTPQRRVRRRNVANRNANAGVTRDSENECTRTGVT